MESSKTRVQVHRDMYIHASIAQKEQDLDPHILNLFVKHQQIRRENENKTKQKGERPAQSHR